MKKRIPAHSLSARTPGIPGASIRKKHRRLYYSVFISLASVVVFCTVYALILPAITMEKNQRVLDCPLSVHVHTDECRDGDGDLICGLADFVIHTHSGDCCDKDGRLVCTLPEIPAHTHTDSCYEVRETTACTDTSEGHIHDGGCQTEKTLICAENAVLHIHDESCRDESGTLVCGMMQVTEHIHGTACFRTAESDTAPTDSDTAPAESDTSPADSDTTPTDSDTATADSDSTPAEGDTAPTDGDTAPADGGDGVMPLAEGDSWGYNDDGSIWWAPSTNLQQVSAVQENVPYIISGCNGNKLMGDQTYEKGGYSYLGAIPGTEAAYQTHCRWYFTSAGGENSYRIRYLKQDGTWMYLRFAGAGVEEWNTPSQQLVLTDQEAQATVFTVKRVADIPLTDSEALKFPDHIAVYAEIDGETYYINSYFGDKAEEQTTHWLGYPQGSGGSCLKICRYEKTVQSADPVESVTSANTVIHMFDYWLSANRHDPDNVSPTDSGINKDHAFRFGHGDGSPALNKWVGAAKLPMQGIVATRLDGNGYPALAGNEGVTGSASTESLQYLFDPKYEHEGKSSFENVNGLLTIDKEGYYFFDCQKTMAEFDEKSESIRLYDKPGVYNQHKTQKGQFFPFNSAPEIMDVKRDDPALNHYFGLTLTTRFVQQHGGHTDDRRTTHTSFSFSGDDDVWIFIDGVLVGDVGGIHDRSSVDINFATGEICVSVEGNSEVRKTTLLECYERAGATDLTEWSREVPDTYRDGSTHTLKFYYLERGNYDSNMKLKYNLTEIPETAIYKVDQYGESVPGATFAVYAANEDYTLRAKKDGETVTLPDTYAYDAEGNITDASGNVLVNSLYTGTTDSNGEMIFKDPDDMPYSLSELQGMFGTHFILREIRVPDGYRVVSGDVHLQIWQGEDQKILKCDNTMQSGSRAASTLQITATDTLYLHTPYNGSDSVQYIGQGGQSNGTLFAVVFKYTGQTDADGNAIGSITDNASWVPVYGTDKRGYTIMDSCEGFEANALEAARMAQAYGNVVFSLSPSGNMQLMIKNLPGHITSYYRMLSAEQKKQAKYTVGYYWTPASSLEEATADSIYRVKTFSDESGDGTHYSGFERVFGADIQVPNLINKVFVQKVDEADNRINGAKFAIWRVSQEDDGTIRYLCTDGQYRALTAGAAPDSDGVIACDGFTVKPLATDETRNYTDGVHTGTAEFTNLSDGQYIIREVRPPPGYKINTADVMVLVTQDTIYANAGTADDGVTVGRGPGYLVSPLSQFASEDQINNTLTWIWAQMRISRESTLFSDVGDMSMIAGYITRNNSHETSADESQSFRTYLKYAEGKEVEGGKVAFNYIPDAERNKTHPDSDGYRRIFTTVGWPYYEIRQDYEYGVTQAAANDNATYENWDGQDLTNLFSRSTYIRITDEQETTVTVKKVDSSNRTVGLSGAKFRMYTVQTADGVSQRLYYCGTDATGKALWLADEAKALILTTVDGGLADSAFTGLKDGTYFLEETLAPAGFYKPAGAIQLTITHAQLTVDSHTDVTANKVLDDVTNLYTYTVEVPDKGGLILPATGGGGTTIYTAGGLLLMAVPLVYGYRKKRRSERRAE